jgi:hypothetical protein
MDTSRHRTATGLSPKDGPMDGEVVRSMAKARGFVLIQSEINYSNHLRQKWQDSADA